MFTPSASAAAYTSTALHSPFCSSIAFILLKTAPWSFFLPWNDFSNFTLQHCCPLVWTCSQPDEMFACPVEFSAATNKQQEEVIFSRFLFTQVRVKLFFFWWISLFMWAGMYLPTAAACISGFNVKILPCYAYFLLFRMCKTMIGLIWHWNKM